MNLSVDCNGRTAEVELLGDGPDVVFIGTAAPMHWTKESAFHLADLGYKVTNFDYGSGFDGPEPRTAIRQAADVLDVMYAVGIGSAHIVGLSRGAMTAFALAAEQPDRVGSLVLAFPVAGWEDTMTIVNPDPEPAPAETGDQFMRRLLGTIYSESFLATNLDEAMAVVSTAPGSVVRVDRSEEATFPAEWSVKHPTLVVEGGADQIVLPPHPRRYLGAIPDSQHVLIPGASHGWLMEEPEEFAKIVAEFLA